MAKEGIIVVFSHYNHANWLISMLGLCNFGTRYVELPTMGA